MVPEFHRLFSIAKRSTQRIQRLTASLLDIDRLEAGYPVVELILSQFETLLHESLREVGPDLSYKGIELDVQIGEKLPELIINEDMIQRVLINLLENAIRHTQPPGQIVVGAKVVNKELWVSIADRGPGIPPSHL